jgi:hypothetical protein
MIIALRVKFEATMALASSESFIKAPFYKSLFIYSGVYQKVR